MFSLRLPRLDLRLAAWAVAAAALSLGGGVLVGTSPLVALDAALLGVAAVLVARYPYHALLLILLVRGTAPNTPLLDGITLVAVGIAVVVRAPRLPGRRVIWPTLGLLALAILSTPLAPTAVEGVKDDWLRVPHFGWPYARNPSVPLYEWIRLASVLAAFCLAVWVVRSRRRLEAVVLAILVSPIVPVVVGLEQFATGHTVARSGQGDEFRAVIGPFSTPGPFAFYLVLVLILVIVTFNEVRSLAARVALGALGVGAGACLLLTYTRSAWVAFALGVIAIAVMRYRRLLLIGWVGLIVALVAFPTVVDKVQERFGDLTSRDEAKSGNSFTWRTGQWRPLLRYGYREPLTGQGFGSYPRLTVDHFGTENNRYPTINDRQHPATSSRGFLAHNDYVRTFVELGVPGLVLWVLMLVGLLTGCLRAVRRTRVGPYAAAGVAVALSLIVIASSDNLLSAPVMLYAFAFCGAVIGVDYGVASAERRRPAVAAEALVVEVPAEEDVDPAAVEAKQEPEPEPEQGPAAAPPTPRRRSLLDSGIAWLRRRRSL